MNISSEKMKRWAKLLNAISKEIRESSHTSLQMARESTLFDMFSAMHFHGDIRLSHKNYSDIVNIFEEYLYITGMTDRIEVDSASCYFAKIIYQEFCRRPKKDWSGFDIKEILTKMHDYIVGKFSDVKIFIQSNLPTDNGVKIFNIAGITFKTYEVFSEENNSKFEEYSNRRCKNKEIISNALSKYEHHAWVAEVFVYNCQEKLATRIAERCLKVIYVYLSALLGKNIYKYIGSPHKFFNESYILIENKQNFFDIIYSKEFSTSENFPTWTAIVTDKSQALRIQCLKILIEKMTKGHKMTLLSKKFLEAVYWYDEAMQEKSHVSAIVKYTTSIEHLIKYKKQKENTTTIFKKRLEFLLNKDIEKENSLKKDIDKMYEMRSSLVHGTMYRDDIEAKQSLNKMRNIASLAIIRFLDMARPSSFFKEIAEAYPIGHIDEYFSKHAPLKTAT